MGLACVACTYRHIYTCKHWNFSLLNMADCKKGQIDESAHSWETYGHGAFEGNNYISNAICEDCGQGAIEVFTLTSREWHDDDGELIKEEKIKN